MPDPFQEILDRLAALEGRSLTVADLPLKPLQDKLEQDWQPQASVLLGSNSVTTAMLAAGVAIPGTIKELAAGIASVDWPGAAVISNFSLAIPHHLDVAPDGVLLTPIGQVGTGPTFAWSEGLAATTFTFRASTGAGGFTPAATTTQNYIWLAVRV